MTSAIAFAVLGAAALCGLVAYVRIAIALIRCGGLVKTDAYKRRDLWVAIALVVLFGAIVTTEAFGKPGHSHHIDVNGMLFGEVFLLVIAEIVVGLLLMRGARLDDLFGVLRLRISRVAGLSILYVTAAMPLALATKLIVANAFKRVGDEQELVTLFRNEVHSGHYSAIVKIAAAAVILAPLIEETLFRGFFYGVFKRYIGAIGGALLSSALFALFHGNLASLAGLFVLSITLTAVYERTGCILVNIGMHALFNSISLLFVYLSSTTAPHLNGA